MAAAVIKFKKYEPDEDICPLLTLKEYLKRTQDLRGDEEKLFISYQKTHKAVSRDTISRWANSFGGGSINTNIYTAHRTCAASTTKAYKARMYLWKELHKRVEKFFKMQFCWLKDQGHL